MALTTETIQLKITADAKELRDNVKGLKGEILSINDGFKGLKPGTKEYADQLELLKIKQRELAQSQTFNELKKDVSALEKELKNLSPATEEFKRKTQQLGVAKEEFANISTAIKGTSAATTGLKFTAEGLKAAFFEFFAITQAIVLIKDLFSTAFANADESIKAQSRLNTALQGREDIVNRLIEKADELEAKSGVSSEVIQERQAYLASLGQTEEEINKIIQASLDYSSGSGKSFEATVTALSKASDGNAAALKKLIPEIGNLTDEQLKAGAAVDLLGDKFKGQTETFGTGLGAFEKLKIKFGNILEDLGKYFLDAGSEGTRFVNGTIAVLSLLLDFLVVGVKYIKTAIEVSLIDPIRALYYAATGDFAKAGEILSSIPKKVSDNYKSSADAIKKSIDEIKESFKDLDKPIGSKKTSVESSVSENTSVSEVKKRKQVEEIAIDVKFPDLKTTEETIVGFTDRSKIYFDGMAKFIRDNYTNDLFDLSQQVASGEISAQEYNDRILQLSKDLNEGLLEQKKELLESIVALEGEDSAAALELKKQIADEEVRIFTQAEKEKTENQKKEQKARQELQKASFDLSKSLIGGIADFDASITEAELQRAGTTEAQKEKIKKEAFERQKVYRILEAGVNLASGIVNILATAPQLGPIAGPIFAGVQIGILSATTIAQVAAIASKKYKKGGIFNGSDMTVSNGPSHENNGIKLIDGSSGQELGEMEGNEPMMILSGNTYKNNKSVVDRLLYSSMYKNGARIFRDGGIFNAPNVINRDSNSDSNVDLDQLIDSKLSNLNINVVVKSVYDPDEIFAMREKNQEIRGISRS